MTINAKKKKIMVITAIATLVVLAAVGFGVGFGIFYQPNFYKVDINAVKAQKPVWEDDFNGASLDSEKWYGNDDNRMTSDPTVRKGGYWSAAQAQVQDGNLDIVTEKVADGNYHTAGVSSKESFRYGYFEISAKLPKAYGIWAAFWMLNPEFGHADAQIAKGRGAEIDIMEAPCYPQSKVQQAIHKGGEAYHHSIFPASWATIDHKTLYDEYHTYSLFWNEDVYKFYIDGKHMWTTTYNNDVSDMASYILLSVEVGGSKGVPDVNPWKLVGGKPIQKLNAEQLALFDKKPAFAIDYVRVWDVSAFRDANYKK